MKGHAEAAQLRREIAAEMMDAEIGQAQRAARDWLKAHPEPVVQRKVEVPRRGLIKVPANLVRVRMRLSGRARVRARFVGRALSIGQTVGTIGVSRGEVAEWLKATVC